MDTLWRAFGVLIFFGGFSLLGWAFEFIDAHRDMHAALMVPVLIALCLVTVAMVLIGIGLVFGGNPLPSPEQESENNG